MNSPEYPSGAGSRSYCERLSRGRDHTTRPTRMDHIVYTTHSRNKLITSALGAAVAAAAPPALLLFGAGTAAAQPHTNPSPIIGLGGVTVHVHD
jgi:hypothetical protein